MYGVNRYSVRFWKTEIIELLLVLCLPPPQIPYLSAECLHHSIGLHQSWYSFAAWKVEHGSGFAAPISHIKDLKTATTAGSLNVFCYHCRAWLRRRRLSLPLLDSPNGLWLY